MFVRRLGESLCLGEVVQAMHRLCIEYPGIRLTTEEKHGKPQLGQPNGVRLFSVERNLFSRLGHRGR